MRHPIAEVRQVKAPSPAALRAAVQAAGEQEQESGWAYARAITDFCDAEAWQHFDFNGARTREAWVREDLHGRYTPSAVTRIVNTVHAVQKLPGPERTKFYAAPFWTVVEALSAESVKEAEAFILAGTPMQEIRARVKARRERKAVAGGGAVARNEAWVPVEFDLPPDLAKRWEGLLNLYRFRLCRQAPATVALLEALITDAEQNWVRDTDPQALTHMTSDGVVLSWTQEQVAAGEIRCRMCNSCDASSLDPHHVIERSHKCKGCGTQHEIPIVLLCRRCHDSIKNGAAGDWAVWANRWGWGALAKQHGGRFEENEIVRPGRPT